MRRLAAALLLLSTPALGADEAPIPVTARPFGELAVSLEGSAPATAVSLNDSRVAAEIGAAVAAIPVRVGDIVEKGAPLVQLACGDFERNLTRAEAQLKGLRAQARFADYQLQRARTLREANTVSEELFNQRETEAAALDAQILGQEAALAQARADVARCAVTAPFRALVLERIAHVGELASPGRELVRVVDLEHVEVSAQVQAPEAESLAEAGELWFEQGLERLPLKLRAVAPVLDPRSRSREARLTFADGAALPGSSGRLVWRDPRPHVPAELVVRREGRYGLFLVSGGVARFHPLPMAQEGRPAAADVPADALVAVKGRYALQDGSSVNME